jgi:hypothetical protein
MILCELPIELIKPGLKVKANSLHGEVIGCIISIKDNSIHIEWEDGIRTASSHLNIGCVIADDVLVNRVLKLKAFL